MRSFILLFTSILVSSHVFSQELKNMGGGGFTVGYGYLDVSDLHRFAPAAPSFSNSHLLIGGEGYGIIGRFVIGGSGQGIISNRIETDSLKISVGGGMGTIDFGYLVLSREKLKIFPKLGVGSSGYGVSISKNRNVSLTKIAKDPASEIKVNKSNFVLDLSINMNFIPQLNENEDDEDEVGGLLIGFKVGATLSPKNSNWAFSGGDVTGGPSFGINMLYAKLTIGGFGGKKI